MVDEDASHHLCGYAEELRTVLPVHRLLIDQTQVSFVDERRRLQSVIGPFAAEIVLREPAQLVVHDWHELVESSPIAFAPGYE
jgi:hypothetical protein